CALTGEATSGLDQVRYRTTPRWVVLLIFFGFVPFLVAWLLTRRVASGVLPLSPGATRRLAVHYMVSLGVCVGIPVICLAAAWPVSQLYTDAAGWLVGIGVFGTLIAVLVSSIWYGRISVRGYVLEPGPWGRWVQLDNVNPTFAAAVERMYALRAAQLRSVGYPLFPPPMPGTPPPYAAGLATVPPPPPAPAGLGGPAQY
ncbi:MAG: hypothetical protein JF886_16420, partial [Candidatus Dormibacteraeota bacterium]|nr:hypothetical protein [Candidatus Dormibacteraeota bacterium]